MRVNGLIDPSTGQPFEDFKNSTYADLFDTIGFIRKDAPEDHLDKIDEIIELKATIRKDSAKISCEGPLRSKKILVDTDP
jgi:hypothetical protein